MSILLLIVTTLITYASQNYGADSVHRLWIKGPNLFAGYHNNPKATADCMTDDGFFKSGDIGYYDLDGHFYITERLKELIKYKGFQLVLCLSFLVLL
jgi:4-coumarate--CoA ligase